MSAVILMPPPGAALVKCHECKGFGSVLYPNSDQSYETCHFCGGDRFILQPEPLNADHEPI